MAGTSGSIKKGIPFACLRHDCIGLGVRRPLRRHSLAAIGRSTSPIPGNSLRELRGRRRDRSRQRRRIGADADAAARGGGEADGDPRGRRILLGRRGGILGGGGGDAEAADGAGVVHLEPGDDAEGVVEVGAGELPGLGGERQVVLADGADGGGLGHLDRGQRGDGGGRGGGLPTSAGAGDVGAGDGAVGVLLEHGDGGGGGDVEGPVVLEAVAVDEAAEVGARLVGVHDEVEVVGVVGVVGERGGGGAGEEQRRGRRRRRWWGRRRRGARALRDEVAVAERAEGPRPGRGGRGRLRGQRDRRLALVAVELRGRGRRRGRLRRRAGGQGGRGRGHGRDRPADPLAGFWLGALRPPWGPGLLPPGRRPRLRGCFGWVWGRGLDLGSGFVAGALHKSVRSGSHFARPFRPGGRAARGP